MRRFQDQMLRIRQHRNLTLCRPPPEQIDNRPVLCIDGLDHGVRKLFPSLTLMGIGLMSTHSQYRIQQQHTLIRPLLQIPVVWNVTAQIILQFLINILQRRRNLLLILRDRKTHAVCLMLIMIRVLPQQKHLHLTQGRKMKRTENLFRRGIDDSPAVLVLNKSIQLPVIFLVKLRIKRFRPVIVQHCHTHILPITTLLYSDRNALFPEKKFQIPDFHLLKMKQRSRQCRIRTAHSKRLVEMLHRPCTAGSDDRNRHLSGDRAGQLQIISGLCTVSVHTGQQDFTGSQPVRLHRPFHRINAHIDPAAVAVNIPAAAVGTLLRINGHHHTLAAEFIRRIGDQPWIHDRCRIDRHLIGPLPQDRLKILHRADSAAHRKGDKNPFRHSADHLHGRRARIGRSGDIQKHQLIRSRLVIGRSDLCRVSRVLKIYKIYPFNNPSVLHVQAGHDSFRMHSSSPAKVSPASYLPTLLISRKFRRICSPTSELFSGWNWHANTLPFSTEAWIHAPYSVVAVTISSSFACR